MEPKQSQFITRKQASQLLHSSLKTIDRLLRDKRIKGFKLGRKVLIYADSLNEENINSLKPNFLN
jgi:excisionase family DNA binding protein